MSKFSRRKKNQRRKNTANRSRRRMSFESLESKAMLGCRLCCGGYHAVEIDLDNPPTSVVIAEGTNEGGSDQCLCR